MTCSAIEIPSDPTADPDVLDRLAAAAAGTGPLLLPHAPGEAPEVDGAPHAAREDRGGFAIGTSGSTGLAKRVVLPAHALVAGADATHDRLGGPGRWLLTLPAHHIAGLQVVLRSLRAGHRPVTMPTDPSGSFTPAAFTAGVRALHGERRYTSLVPTQLSRILGDEEAVAAAADLDAILLGGSAVSPTLLEQARESGIHVVVTYGMSETAGGCVYDGVPLDGVHLRLDHGRIHLAGRVLATGYLLPRSPAEEAADPSAFVDHGGIRWFRTSDMGHLDQGRLVVDGRVDDVITSGGLKVWPAEVERILAPALPTGCDLVVVGLPDPEWGQRVAVAVECPHATPCLLTDLIDHARETLPPHARPRLARALRRLPRIGIGKIDRARVASLLMEDEWDDEDSPRKG